jgi:hypothetical protein
MARLVPASSPGVRSVIDTPGWRIASPWKCRATLSHRRQEQGRQDRDARITALLPEALQLVEERQE